MTCFRDWRGLVAALLLLPLAALLIGRAAGPAEAQGAQTSPDRPSLSTSEQRVRPNELVTVRGRFRPASTQSGGVGGSAAPASQPVRIQFRALGSKHWRDARSTRAGKAGRFKERVKIERSGRIRAVSADGRATPTRKVRVRSVTRASVEKRARVGQKVTIRGHVAPAGQRRKVTIRVGGEELRARTNRTGRFRARWKPDDAGRSKVKVRSAGNLVAAGSTAKAGRVTVFRSAEASWYGPGLYGNGVACGGTLKPSTMGVAHKTLPCGTKLTIRYHGRQVRAKVIDRGPYVAGRDYDLTTATKLRLGFPGVGTVLANR